MPELASFKHHNLDIISYGSQLDADDRPVEAAGPTLETNQLVSDWDRYVNNPKACPYYINGKHLSELTQTGFLPPRRTQSPTQEMLAAETPEEKKIREEDFRQAETERQANGQNNLEQFFEAHFFEDIKNEEKEGELLINNDQRHALIQAAMQHFHQGGLPHATNLSINKQNTTQHKLLDPERKIYFDWTKDGLLITEENTYKEWVDNQTGAKHKCSGDEPYFAETKSSYLLTPNAEIKLLDVTIDCPSAELAEVFDKRPANEQPTRLLNMSRRLETMMHFKRAMMDTRPPESRTLYQSNSKHDNADDELTTTPAQ